MKPLTNKPLSEKEELLLAAYCDGELSADECARVEARFGHDLEETLARHRALQSELRSMISDRLKESEESGKGGDIWRRIEVDVRKIAANYDQQRRQPRFVEIFRELFGVGFSGRGVAVGLAALALMVFVNLPRAGTQLASDSGDDQTMRLAREFMPTEMLDRRLEDIARVSFAPDYRTPLAVASGTMKEYRDRLLQRTDSTSGGPFVTQVVNREFVLGGLREDETDFDLLHSDRAVDLVAAEDHAAPPTIWLAQQASSAGLIDTVSDLKVRPEAVN